MRGTEVGYDAFTSLHGHAAMQLSVWTEIERIKAEETMMSVDLLMTSRRQLETPKSIDVRQTTDARQLVTDSSLYRLHRLVHLTFFTPHRRSHYPDGIN